jgi:hypothetical protein
VMSEGGCDRYEQYATDKKGLRHGCTCARRAHGRHGTRKTIARSWLVGSR